MAYGCEQGRIAKVPLAHDDQRRRVGLQSRIAIQQRQMVLSRFQPPDSQHVAPRLQTQRADSGGTILPRVEACLVDGVEGDADLQRIDAVDARQLSAAELADRQQDGSTAHRGAARQPRLPHKARLEELRMAFEQHVVDGAGARTRSHGR